MKLKLHLKNYFTIYFFLMLGLYHYKVKSYFYWTYVAHLKDSAFAFSFVNFLVAVAIFGIDLYFLMGVKKTKFIFIILSLFFALLTIPSLIAFTAGEMYPIQILIYHQLFFFALLLFSKIEIDFSKIPVLNKKLALYLLLILTAIGSIPYLIIYGPHINLKNLFLIDVYETRTQIGALSNPYFGYTYSVFTKIIIPLIIVFALELKKTIWVFVGVGFLLLFYLFGAHKTVLFSVFVVFMFYRFTYYGAVKKIISLSSALIVVFVLLAAIGIDYPWIISFRRVHFLPTLLDICYLDFFKDQPIYWSESILKSFFEYPFDLKHTNLIGEAYFNSAAMAANNGLISDGYMNFGTLGVLVNCSLVAGYFMILNSLKIPARYFGLFVLMVFSFLSSSTLTVFLTHGALVLLLISIFLLNDKKS